MKLRLKDCSTFLLFAGLFVSFFSYSQTVPQLINIHLDFMIGLPKDITSHAVPVRTLVLSGSEYEKLLERWKVISAGLYQTESVSYGLFLCKDTLNSFLLVDSYGHGSQERFRRYEPSVTVNGNLRFPSVEFKQLGARDPLQVIYLTIDFDQATKRFNASTNWCRRGKFSWEGRDYDVVLAKLRFPGDKFRLDYTSDYLTIDLDHDGTFDLLDEGNPITASFTIHKNKYKVAEVDSLGRNVTLKFEGIDSVHLEVGDPCPPISIKYLDGTVDSMIGREGNVTLIDFWATWCGPCVAEFPELKELWHSYGDRGLKIVGLSVDQFQNELNAFLGKNNLPWPVASIADRPNESVQRLFRVSYYPRHIVIDRHGVFRGGGTKLRSTALKDLIESLLKNP